MTTEIYKPTEEELKEILDNHKLWLNDNSKGKRAYLQGADLQRADLRRAYLQGADLRGAYLQGAYLQRAYLQGAYLQRADLQRADLRGAYLRRADLQGAYLQRADLRGADLRGADLQRADLRGAEGIIYIQSQYIYQSYGYYFNNKMRVRLGCFDRTIEEWDADFWNNDGEFPENSEQGKNRFMIYAFIKQWLLANLNK